MLVRFYKLTRISQNREVTLRSENQSFFKIILVVTIALFFAFLTTICNVQTGLLVNTLVLYLLLGNRPITRYIEKGSKVLSTLDPFSIYILS